MGFINTKKKFLISSLVEKRRVTVSSHMNVESRLQYLDWIIRLRSKNLFPPIGRA